jgi:hypothetical protein
VADGRNLLLQLASGALSTGKLAEADVRIAERVQEAGRRNQFWGLNWEAVPRYLTLKDPLKVDIVVGCVDRVARRSNRSSRPRAG